MPFAHFRSAVVLSAASLLGLHSVALPHDPTPQTHVAEASIWGENNGFKGYSFLPVNIHGHIATVVIDLNCTECDLSLSTAALGKLGITIPAASTLDSMTIGTDVQRDIPLQIITKPTWNVPGPSTMPPVVGIVGVHFLTTHYDILYDFPDRRVQLYAFPKKPAPAGQAWLPEGFKASGCGKMVHVPPGAATFTGMMMQIDGHPVTGVLEMGPYIPKLNELAANVLALPANSPRIEAVEPGRTDGGHPMLAHIKDVHMAVGTESWGSWKVEELDHIDAEELLPHPVPIMLLNLSMMRKVKLYNSTSSQQVCLSAPEVGVQHSTPMR